MKKKNLILVTGLLRTGTTWTGKTIAEAKGIKYLNEPFNPDRGRKEFPLDYYFQYIGDHQPVFKSDQVKRYIDRMIYSPTYILKDQLRLFKKYNIITINNICKLCRVKNIYGRPLMKDPMAILSAEWIYRTFNADVVVVLRHPAAFVGSLKTAGWAIPFNDLLAQERMLSENFSEFIPQIKQYSQFPPDIIDQGILIWNIIYTAIKHYIDHFGKEWYFVKHEDLSKDPVSEFSRIFQYLDLDFSSKIRSRVVKSTNGSVFERLSRNSVQNLETWKFRLTPEEMVRIRTGTEQLCSIFYPEDYWE